MTKFVIAPDVAWALAERGARVPAPHRLLAPTLLRSQVLAMLFDAVRHGRLERRQAERQLDHLRGLRIRLLGDRVLQGLAWTLAEQLGWHDTFVAEYLALTACRPTRSSRSMPAWLRRPAASSRSRRSTTCWPGSG